MRVVVKFRFPEQEVKYISIDENQVLIMQNDNEEILETTKDDRLMTLFNLFSFKDDWKSENVESAIYEVLFLDSDEELYRFNIIPDNWVVFMGYIVRLVGDVI